MTPDPHSQPMTDDPFVEAMKAEDAKWGDDPAALRETIVKLTERCEAYKGQVKAGSDRIQELEAALKPFAELIEMIECTTPHEYSDAETWEVPLGKLRAARAAMKGEA